MLQRFSEQTLLVDGEEISVALHASVLRAPADGVNVEHIEQSLIAVLAEAQSRDQRVLAFTEEVRARATRSADLERDLRNALPLGQFELFLQPKFNAASQRLTGAEALLRWRHPQRGLISPAEFIPVLEETGLIIEVGAWVRREGLAIWRRWHMHGHSGFRIAVNVSARELRHANFISDCTALLERTNREHGLDIEVTESMFMDDIGKCIRVLQALRDLGCKIGIDDFGTGYSSLNYLSRLPADVLKIDQSFTMAVASSPDTLSLVTNIISLAHSLRLCVVAEGVEEEEQAKLLRLLRCDELQGYLMGRPMPVADFERTYLNL
jgi:EAL domain-containing protein (putative c-di-GMP-specific phosphodiesterase class I)